MLSNHKRGIYCCHTSGKMYDFQGQGDFKEFRICWGKLQTVYIYIYICARTYVHRNMNLKKKKIPQTLCMLTIKLHFL